MHCEDADLVSRWQNAVLLGKHDGRTVAFRVLISMKRDVYRPSGNMFLLASESYNYPYN
jgi:hypothetical protein